MLEVLRYFIVISSNAVGIENDSERHNDYTERMRGVVVVSFL